MGNIVIIDRKEENWQHWKKLQEKFHEDKIVIAEMGIRHAMRIVQSQLEGVVDAIIFHVGNLANTNIKEVAHVVSMVRELSPSALLVAVSDSSVFVNEAKNCDVEGMETPKFVSEAERWAQLRSSLVEELIRRFSLEAKIRTAYELRYEVVYPLLPLHISLSSFSGVGDYPPNIGALLLSESEFQLYKRIIHCYAIIEPCKRRKGKTASVSEEVSSEIPKCKLLSDSDQPDAVSHDSDYSEWPLCCLISKMCELFPSLPESHLIQREADCLLKKDEAFQRIITLLHKGSQELVAEVMEGKGNTEITPKDAKEIITQIERLCTAMGNFVAALEARANQQ